MRILYILPWLQHPAIRGSHRHYHFIRELSQRHRITLLTLAPTPIPAEVMDEMTRYTERLLIFKTYNHNSIIHKPGKRAFIGRKIKPLLLRAYGLKKMKQAFTDLIQHEDFDVILFHGKSVFQVISGKYHLPLVVDFCDATSMRIRSRMRFAGLFKVPLLALRYLQIRRVEQQLLRRAAQLAFISHRDREATVGNKPAYQILPNGIDIDYWQRKAPYAPAQPCIVFHGVMDYAPNEDAALYLIEHILPLLQKALPDVAVYIVGRNPSAALVARAEHTPGLTVTGFVEDIREYLEQAAICAIPLRYASGMQNKVLEAMAMEVPVVATSVAADGLRVDGAETPPVCIGDTPEEFAQQIIRLLHDPHRRGQLARQGRAYVKQYFVWAGAAELLEQLCIEATLHRQPVAMHTSKI